MNHLVTAAVGAGVAIAAMLLAQPADAAPLCEHRSAAHIAKHGGLRADSAWHVANGELPTCDPGESYRDSLKSEFGESSSETDKNTERKSRYCRKRWFC